MLSNIFGNKTIKIPSIVELFLFIYLLSLITVSNMKLGSVTSKFLGIFLIFVFFLFDIFLKKEKFFYSHKFLFLFFWFFMCVISGYFAVNPKVFYSEIFTVLQLIVLFITVYHIILFYKIDISMIFDVIIFSCIALLVFGVVTSSDMSWAPERMASTTGNANVFAVYLSYGIIFSIYQFLTKKNLTIKLFYLVIVLFLIFGILESGSRKGILIIPIYVFLTYVMNGIIKYRNNWRKFFLNILLILIVSGIFLYIIYLIFSHTAYFSRFERLINFLKMQGLSENASIKTIVDYSTYERRQFIKHGFRMWLDHPIIGVGLDQFRERINEYWTISRKTYSHCNYIEVLSTTGILGFIPYYFFLFFLFFRIKSLLIENLNIKRIKYTLLLFSIIIVGILVLDFVRISYSDKLHWIVLSIVTVYTDNLKYISHENVKEI